jgi:hypothetical protein
VICAQRQPRAKPSQEFRPALDDFNVGSFSVTFYEIDPIEPQPLNESVKREDLDWIASALCLSNDPGRTGIGRIVHEMEPTWSPTKQAIDHDWGRESPKSEQFIYDGVHRPRWFDRNDPRVTFGCQCRKSPFARADINDHVVPKNRSLSPHVVIRMISQLKLCDEIEEC